MMDLKKKTVLKATALSNTRASIYLFSLVVLQESNGTQQCKTQTKEMGNHHIHVKSKNELVVPIPKI